MNEFYPPSLPVLLLPLAGRRGPRAVAEGDGDEAVRQLVRRARVVRRLLPLAALPGRRQVSLGRPEGEPGRGARRHLRGSRWVASLRHLNHRIDHPVHFQISFYTGEGHVFYVKKDAVGYEVPLAAHLTSTAA